MALPILLKIPSKLEAKINITITVNVKMELCVNTSNLKFTPDVTSDGRGQNVTWNNITLNLIFILTYIWYYATFFVVLSSDNGLRKYNEIFRSLLEFFAYLDRLQSKAFRKVFTSLQ